jgi:hypothetical protein
VTDEFEKDMELAVIHFKTKSRICLEKISLTHELDLELLEFEK